MLDLQEKVAGQYKHNFLSDFMLEIQDYNDPITVKLLTLSESHHPAMQPLLDPQCINLQAFHVHTCLSWPAAIATHVNFFSGSMQPDFLLPSSPFILCESITATKQNTVVH